MKMPKADLIAMLKDMIVCIQTDDSFEGTVTYSVMEENLGPGELEVSAFYRYGNSYGQGGCVVIQGDAQPEEAEEASTSLVGSVP